MTKDHKIFFSSNPSPIISELFAQPREILQVVIPIYEEISILVTQIIAKFLTGLSLMISMSLEIELFASGKLEKRFEGQWGSKQDTQKILGVIS